MNRRSGDRWGGAIRGVQMEPRRLILRVLAVAGWGFLGMISATIMYALLVIQGG